MHLIHISRTTRIACIIMASEEVLKIIKQGAEARLFVGNFSGRLSIFKERFVKKYRHPTLDSTLTKERMKSEARALAKCRSIGIRTPAVYKFDLEGRRIIMEYLEDSITVGQYIQEVIIKHSGDNKTIESILFPLMEEIGRTLGKMHCHSIIHGDLTTSNAMLRGNVKDMKLYIIDFGLSSVSDSAESKAVDLYVLERAFLSSHPNSESLFAKILDTYQNSLPKKCKVIDKFNEVRLRGRKRCMVG